MRLGPAGGSGKGEKMAESNPWGMSEELQAYVRARGGVLVIGLFAVPVG
jgi:hypothetical protein